MATSRRQQVIEIMFARLTRVRRTNGFNTDAGALSFLGFAPALGPDDGREAIALRVGDDDAPRFQQEQLAYSLPLECQALADAAQFTSEEMPWLAVEAILQDIKRAVELPRGKKGEAGIDEVFRFGRLLAGDLERGQTVTLEREPGSTVVGVSVTYLAPIAELWGEP